MMQLGKMVSRREAKGRAQGVLAMLLLQLLSLWLFPNKKFQKINQTKKARSSRYQMSSRDEGFQPPPCGTPSCSWHTPDTPSLATILALSFPLSSLPQVSAAVSSLLGVLPDHQHCSHFPTSLFTSFSAQIVIRNLVSVCHLSFPTRMQMPQEQGPRLRAHHRVPSARASSGPQYLRNIF